MLCFPDNCNIYKSITLLTLSYLCYKTICHPQVRASLCFGYGQIMWVSVSAEEATATSAGDPSTALPAAAAAAGAGARAAAEASSEGNTAEHNQMYMYKL